MGIQLETLIEKERESEKLNELSKLNNFTDKIAVSENQQLTSELLALLAVTTCY